MTKTALMATTALLFASSAAWAGDEPQVAEAPVPTGATSQAAPTTCGSVPVNWEKAMASFWLKAVPWSARTSQ